MTTHIIHSYISTDFGTHLWDQVYEEDRVPQPEQTLLQRLKYFLETEHLYEKIICTDKIMQGLKALSCQQLLQLFPDTLDGLAIEVPTWLLADDGKTGIVGCVFIGEFSHSPHGCPFDWLFTLMYENHLKQSPIFGELA